MPNTYRTMVGPRHPLTNFSVASMQPHYPTPPRVHSRAVVGESQRSFYHTHMTYGPGGRGLHGLGAGMDATANPPDPTAVQSSDDLTGTAFIHVVGAAVVGAAGGAFAAHSWKAAGPGALGMAGLVTLFEAGRTLTAGKGTLGVGMGLAAALMITGGWILAKDQAKGRSY